MTTMANNLPILKALYYACYTPKEALVYLKERQLVNEDYHSREISRHYHAFKLSGLQQMDRTEFVEQFVAGYMNDNER